MGRMDMMAPVILIPWSSTFPAAGLVAAIRRSASRPLLVTVKNPPAWREVAEEVRAQGRLISMLMASLSISFCRGQRLADAIAVGRPARTGGALSSSTSQSSKARVLGRLAEEGGQTNHHALPESTICGNGWNRRPPA